MTSQYAHIVLSCLILSCYLCPHALGYSNVSSVKCFDSERKALLQFKHGISQDSCGLLTSWRDDTDCCEWHGVQCSHNTGHVIMLRLQGTDIYDSCLTGNLSYSLGELKYMSHLNLNFNQFNQPILDFLGSLSNLEYLSLRHTCDGYGEYSYRQNLQWLTHLSLLRYLDLSGAYFSEAKNWIQIVSQLPSLRVLRMDDCLLPLDIPSSLTFINSSSHFRKISLSNIGINDSFIFQWLFSLPQITTHLEYLDLSSNSLVGPIPNGFGNLQRLSHLHLSHNHLEGPFPNDFRNLQHLLHLDISHNHLEGPIPIEFSSLHSLSYLSLSYNNIQGSVFKIFSGLCNLQQLYLRANNFTGELTNVIRALRCVSTKLLKLDLGQNHFLGGIPETISSFSLLKELYLDGNQLSGNITQSIGQLPMLEKLDTSSNSFNATLTHSHFLNLSRLRELYLSDNTKIVISIDASWNPPFQLDTISLRSCKLGPSFPNWLKTQTNFSYLDVSNAEISDRLPVSFWNSLSSSLEYMNMSYNHFRGPIPNLSQTFGFHAPEVDLRSNFFEGDLPSWLSNFTYIYLSDNRFSDFSNIFCPKTTTYLEIVDLSNNLLSEELPDCWMNFYDLSSLHLENNRISGNIPNSIGYLNGLEYFYLQNNSFSGVIPASLKNCVNLIILNLGYNSFTGNIPPWIGNYHSLGALILRRNNFYGNVPARLCQLPNLQILDFGMNQISGVIPGCLGNLSAMTGKNSIGLYNGVDGVNFGRGPNTIVGETVSLTWKGEEQMFKFSVDFIKSIDLSCNKLCGEIPLGIFNLTGLVSLDLSKNNLSGSISSEIGQLTALELLDLSDNRLTGNIPSSLAKLSFLAIVGLSNNNLSGKIPLGTQLQNRNASSYTGNPGLCGMPLPVCPGDQTPLDAFSKDDSISVQDEHDDIYSMSLGLYISVVLGLITGFWGVFGTLVIKRYWRYACFRLLHGIQDKLYEIIIGVVS